MNSHLTILAGEKPLVLPNKISVQLTDQNPLFHEDEMYSLNIQVPLEGNRQVFKNVDDRNAEARLLEHEHTPMQIIADGIPFRSGVQIMAEGEEIQDSVVFNVDAQAQSFRDLIGTLNCNEVMIPEKYHDKLLIGEKIGNVSVRIDYKYKVEVKYKGKKNDKPQVLSNDDFTHSLLEPQALGFSYPAKCETTGTKEEAVIEKKEPYSNNNSVNKPKVIQSYINTDKAYPMSLYCNARVCYKHYGLNEDGTTSDQDAEDNAHNELENYGPIWVLDANRPQSGICFYILFFLDCLFEQLGVQFDNSALMQIGDMQRLCFYTTKCKYDVEPLHYGELYKPTDPEVIAGRKTTKDIKSGFFKASTTDTKNINNIFKDVNAWLSSRGCGGQLSLDTPKNKSFNEVKYDEISYFMDYDEEGNPVYNDDESTAIHHHDIVGQQSMEGYTVTEINSKSTVTGASMEASIMAMYANNENFPKESVSSVIDSLEKQFGIKFAYDYEQKKVTAYLLRDVFRDSTTPRTLHATILDMVPVTEKITGVKVGYSAEDDKKEQQKNVREGITDYDTDYNYIEYPKNRTVTDKTYQQIISEVTKTQMNVFVDLTTGNKYRVKIDGDFTTTNNMYERLFEVGANHGVEFGDCSPSNEDFVIDMRSEFSPVPMVDVYFRRAAEATTGEDKKYHTTEDGQPPITPGDYKGYRLVSANAEQKKTIMVANVDQEMEHEFVEQRIKNTQSSVFADFYVVESLKLRESYDPTKTDDGNSPLQSIDWGLAIAIMRGGGVNAVTQAFDPDYDGFGNSKWRTVVGEYALTTDSIDPYGNIYDYNGDWPGIGREERFSLKPRAWVQPEWAEEPLVINDPMVKNRGWVDTFLIEYIYFLLHRKKFRVTALCSVAQLADVPNHWKEWWNIDGKKCLIDKMEYSIDAQKGLSMVTMDIYAI